MIINHNCCIKLVPLVIFTKTLTATSKNLSLSLSGYYSKLIQKCSVESGLFMSTFLIL